MAGEPRGGGHVMFQAPSTAILLGQSPPKTDKTELPAITKSLSLKQDPRPAQRAQPQPARGKKGQSAPPAKRMQGAASPAKKGKIGAHKAVGSPGGEEALRGRPARSASTPPVHQQPEVNYLPCFSPQLISLERYTLSVYRAGETDLFENLHIVHFRLLVGGRAGGPGCSPQQYRLMSFG